MSTLVERLNSALTEQRWEDYEEIWLDALEGEGGDFGDYVQAADDAIAAGESERAGAMLALLAPQAEHLDPEMRCAFTEALVRCMPKQRDYREALLAAYEACYGDRAGYSVFIKAANLKRTKEPEKSIPLFHRMVNFVPGAFVFHRSGWGVGEIREIRPLEAVAIIDFEKKNGHQVAVTAIPDICELLPSDHFKVLVWRHPEQLQEIATNRPMELIKNVLRSAGRPLPLARIREQISGRVMPSSDWSKWWTKARNELKKDSEIGVGGDKTPEYFIREGEVDELEELATRLKGSDLKTRVRLLREAADDRTPADQLELHPFFDRVLQAIQHKDGDPPMLLEAILFLHRHGYDAENLPVVAELLKNAENPGDLINGMSRIDDQTEIIDLLRSQDPEGWETLHTSLLLGADDGPREYLIRLMEEEERHGEIDKLAREVNQLPKRAPLFFLWMTRCRCGAGSDLVPSLNDDTPADYFLRATLLLDDIAARSSHAPDDTELLLQLKRFRQRLSNRPYTIMLTAIEGADLASVREIYHQVEGCRGFSDTIRKRMLAALLRVHPQLLSSKRKATAKIDESTIYATEEAIIRKRKELEYLRNERLPEIYALIGDAAAMGDLSENYEFTSAIEERENCNRRVMELQAQLDGVVQIDVSKASTEHVSLGSRATLTNLESGQEEIYSLLGPWDGDPEHGVVSYLSPLGLALMDKATGQEFDVKLPSGVARYRVEGIQLHTDAATNGS